MGMRHSVMQPTTLRFFFDYLSPYSYLAWTQVVGFTEKHGLELQPQAVLLAAFLNHHGHKGPGEIPPKRRYAYKDCVRRAAVLGVPINPPAVHPFNPLLPLRVSVLEMDAPTRIELISRLYAAAWVESRDVSDTAVVAEICDAVGVPDAVARTREPDIKRRLLDVGTEAIARGAFGVPTMLVGDEVFWGEDSFGHIAQYLRGEDPAANVDAWDAIPVGAQR